MPENNGQRAGGRRSPSIRRLLYLLVAVPLLTIIGLYAFVLCTTVGDAVNLDRAPNLINATSVPAAQFDVFIQTERRASMMYLAAPTRSNRAQLDAARAATAQAFPAFRSQMTSAATTQSATTGETDAINRMITDIQQLGGIRSAVAARAITPDAAMAAYGGILTDELNLFRQENRSLTNTVATAESLASIDTVEAREALSQEDAVVSAALSSGQLTAPARVQISQLAGARAALIQNGLSRFNASGLAAYDRGQDQYAPAGTIAQLTTLEQAVGADNTPFMPFTAAQWDPVAQAVLNGYFAGGVDTARHQVASDGTFTSAAWRRVALAGGVGLLGLVLSAGLSILIGRWIIRRLGRLEASAVTQAGVELPGLVARLRRGEDVPVEELTGPPADFGRDEIGRVAQAFDAARRTAIEAAAGEARTRRGINDVFRNLARRNQSLLYRELSVLDAMERRTTDPETLEDLFRLDHLATRMRRHSEGLIILSGAAPGRGWVHPVRMIDVLRAAAAEVEDYSRVSVTTPSQAALTGPAVADVIHLLAELIENATTLSPPYTPVNVTGALVASGFAVEVEDRGLGMSEQRYAELNARLAEPPEFDVFNSEQLGLFVVGQLAKRHGIRVTLRPSPYGGTTAIALIPATVVGVEQGSAEGVPTGMSAISPAWAAGRDNTGTGPASASPPRTQLGGQPWHELPQGGSPGQVNGDTQVSGSQDPFASFGPGPSSGSAPYAGQPYASPVDGGAHAASGRNGSPYGERPYGTDPQTGQAYGWISPPSGSPFGTPGQADTSLPWPYDRPAPSPGGGTSQPPAGPPSAAETSYAPGESYRPYAQDQAAFPPPGAPFPPPRTPLPPAGPPYPQAQPSWSEPGPAVTPAEQAGPGAESAFPPAEPSFPSAPPRNEAGDESVDVARDETVDVAGNEAGDEADETYKGLPKRVRQASLAPQLRDRNAPAGTPSAASGENVANRSPDDIRTALSAMQHGWQQGRAASEAGVGEPGDTLPGGSPAAFGDSPSAFNGTGRARHAGPDAGILPGDERLVTDTDEPAAPDGGDAGCTPGGNGHGAGYGRADAGGSGTADDCGVGCPDYAAEPDDPASPGQPGHGTDPGRASHSVGAFPADDDGGADPASGGTPAAGGDTREEQGYRGTDDDA